MATAEDLWGARSADAKAFADSLLSASKPAPKKKKTKSIDVGSLGRSVDDFENLNKTEWYDTPMVKGIIDALVVGTHISAATGNAVAESGRAGNDEFKKSGNIGSAVGAYLGEGVDQVVNHNPAVMGIKASMGDEDSVRTYSDVIKNTQSAFGGEEYANTETNKGLQGGVGFAADVLLDPTLILGTGALGSIAGGAIKGGVKGAKAAKDVAAGGEALGRTVGRRAGIKAGVKEGLAGYKQAKVDKLNLGIAKRDINLKGASPELYRENIRGFDSLPEDVIKGERKLTGKDIRGANSAANKAEKTAQVSAKAVEKETADEMQKLADTEELTYVQTPEDIAKEAVRANAEFFSGAISVGKHNAVIRTLKGTAKMFGHDYDSAVESYLVKTGLKEPTAAPEAAIKAEKVPESPVAAAPSVGKEISPEVAKAQEVKSRLENPESITPAYNYVENPGNVNAAQFLKDSPVDEFVKGTAHLTADVPRMTGKTQSAVADYLKSHPSASRTVKSPEIYDARELQKFLASGSLRSSTKNPEKVIHNFRGRFNDGKARGEIGMYERRDLVELIDKTMTKHSREINKLRAAGDEAGAKALLDSKVSEMLKSKVYVEDLAKLVNSVKNSVVSPEVVEFAWNGAKPTPRMLKELGFKGDIREAMKTIKEFGANLNSLSRKSGAFRDILAAYRNGNLPVEDMARFEEFASSFFKLTGEDRLNRERILEMASDFLQKNSDAIVASSILHAPTADSGRLAGLLGGGESPAKGLLRILPPESATTYSRPFREDERIRIVEAMAEKAEADIINGFSPEFVGKAADEIIDRHFKEYSTKSGDLVTRDGWHTSTMNLTDGLPKKEFFWTTHSAIDLFSKLNETIRVYMKNIPELDEIRTLRYSKPTAANIKNYEVAFRNVKDNLGMRILAHVDVQLKAHNVFGYLTNAMPNGDTAIRLSMYDVMNAIGPELRMKHMWTPKGDINNFRPTQIMNVAEVLIRTLKGADVSGEIDTAMMLKNAQEIMKGNFAKNSDAAGIVRFIEQNLDESDRAFNAGIVAHNLEAMPKANTIRNTKYTQFIGAVINKVGEDGLTPLQRLADTVLKNTAMHASQFSSKIVYATEQQMKRLTQSLEFGTVGNFSEVVSSIVRPDHFEPEVSKVFADEVRAANLLHVSPDELRVAQETANVAKLSTNADLVLHTSKEMEPYLKKTPTDTIAEGSYFIPTGPKPRDPKRIALSTKNATEVMLNGRRILTDGKNASTKWSIQPWVSKAGDQLKKDINAANAKVAEAAQNMALHPDSLLETVAKASDEEIVNMFRQELAHDVSRRMFVGQRMFNVRFGMEMSYDSVTSGAHLGTALETAFHASINQFAKKYTQEQSRMAFKELQSVNANIHELVSRGAIEGLDPAVVDMAKLTGTIFDSSTNNFYVRNGVGPDLMNSILDSMTNVPWRFPTRVDGELITPAQMGEVWKTWTNIENPYKALAAVHTAMIKASSDISMGARFSNRFGMQAPPVGEADKWAKLGNIEKTDNAFIGVIDTELYYPKQIISELPELGRFITASRTFKNEKFQQWVNSFDEFTSALKLTQTVMKPGHHVMSVIGDYFRNSLAGVKGNGVYKDTWRIMRERNAADKGLSELDKYANIKNSSLELSVQTKTSGKGTRLIVGGKQIIMDDGQMYDLFIQRGIFLPPHNAGVAEDLLAVAHHGDFSDLPGGPVANTVSKVTAKTNAAVSGLVNNKVIKLNSFTAQRDNVFRGGLAIHFLKSKNFRSIEEAIDFAEQNVRKWAPTAKDLTAMESKYNRRVFLYYTWMRGMIPRVVEGMVARPGVATIPSKAMYNLAIANGLNPNTIGDPFDPNELMPDYYTNGVLGPQWMDPNNGHLWGLNPTGPVIDIFNSLGAGSTVAGLNPFQDNSNYERVGRTLMGMTNPIFRSPIELTINRNIGTDSPIQDDGQYLTDMPGPVRYASKVTGHTINPMLGGLPRRTEAKFNEGMTEGEWWNNAGLETLNYGLGLQVRDYTSESAVKSAEYQEKEKERQEQKIDSRTDWWK